MPLLLPPPEQQFVDADGKPYAGGSITALVPGTSTPKDTWQDPLGTVLNTNPIILDAAGRAIIYGDGDYVLQLRDADGNLINDGLTSSTISDAMLPVVTAPTIDDAKTLLGILDFSAAIAAETARAEAAEATLTANLAAEVTRAEAAEAHLQSEIDALSGVDPGGIKAGVATTDSTGRIHVTFASPFATQLLYMTIIFGGGPRYFAGAQPPSPGDSAAGLSNTFATGDFLDKTGFKIQVVDVVDPTTPSTWVPYGAGVSIGWWCVGY